MSILETFYILFKTDADEAAKDIKKVDDASDGAADGRGKMDDVSRALAGSLAGLAKGLLASAAALFSVGSIMNVVVDRAAAVRELDQFSSKLNSSIEDVDAFQRSVKGMGDRKSTRLNSSHTAQKP